MANDRFNYEISQSISGSFTTEDTLEFSFQSMVDDGNAKNYSEQFVNFQYSVLSASADQDWIQWPGGVYPKKFTIGTTQYNKKSFIISPSNTDINQNIQTVKAIITGSIGKDIKANPPPGTAPEFNIDYDDFKFSVESPKVELTDQGLLIFTSPSRYLRVTKEGFEMQGGEVTAEKVKTNELEVFGDVTVFGDFQASSIPANDAVNSSDTAAVGTSQGVNPVGDTTAAGQNTDYARADHIHKLPFGVVNTLISDADNTLTHVSASNVDVVDTLTAGTIITSIITSSVAEITGSTNFGSSSLDTHEFTGSLLISGSIDSVGAATFVGNISGSATSTGSFGALNAMGSVYIGDSAPIHNHSSNMVVIDSSDSQILSIRRNNANRQWNFGISTAGDLNFYERTNDAGTGTNRVQFLKDGGASFGSHITASGNISSSVNSTASFGQIISNGEINLKAHETYFRINSNPVMIQQASDFRFGALSTAYNTYFQAGLDKDLSLVTDGTARLFVSGTGEVGIGTTTPEEKLHLGSGNIFLDDNTSKIYFGQKSDNFQLIEKSSHTLNIVSHRSGQRAAEIKLNADTLSDGYPKGSITFRTAKTSGQIYDRMIINESGSVGIGTITPTKTLTVAGDISASGDLTIGNTDYMDYDANITIGGDTATIFLEDTGLGLTDNGRMWRLKNDGGTFSISETGRATNSTTGTSQILTISASGNVGIGTTSPSHQLSVSSSGNGQMSITRTGGTSLFFQSQASLGQIGTSTNHDLQFITNDGGRMTIDTSGNVGIGTTNPQKQLHISSSAGAGNIGISDTTNYPLIDFLDNTGTKTNFRLISNGANNELQIRSGSNDALMTIEMGGNVGIGTTSPPENLSVVGNINVNTGYYKIDHYGTMLATNTDKMITNVGGGQNGGLGLHSRNTKDIVFYTNDSTELMRISSSGNVGIGTTSPGAPLQINANSDNVGSFEAFLVIKDTDTTAGSHTATIEWQNNSGNSMGAITGNSADSKTGISFLNSSGDRTVKILDGGNVGIGTLNPAKELTVEGDISASGTVFADRFESKTGGTTIDFNDSIDLEGHLTASGNITAGGNISASGTTHTFGGNVGIGVSPSHTLEVKGTESTLARFYDAGNGSLGQIEIGTMDIHVDNNVMRLRDGADNTLVYLSGSRMGIGTTNPQYTLDIYRSDTNPAVRIYGTANKQLTLGGDSLGGFVGTITNDDLRFITNNGTSVPVTIKTSGNVGIGTTSPSEKLHISSSGGLSFKVQSDSGSIYFESATSTATRITNGNANMFYKAYSHRFEAGSTNYTDRALLDMHRQGSIKIGDAVGEAHYTSSMFSVVTSSTDLFWVGKDGKVGIGTDTPTIRNGHAGQSLTIAGSSAGLYIQETGEDDKQTQFIISNGRQLEFGTMDDTGDNSVEHMVISSSGNIGIGTSSPETKLHIVDTTNTELRIQGIANETNEGASVGLFESANGVNGGRLRYDGGTNTLNLLGVDGSGTERLGIAIKRDDGNVGINTDNPQYQLHIDGDISVGSGSSKTLYFTDSTAYIQRSTHDLIIHQADHEIQLKNNDDLILDTAYDIVLDTDGGDILFKDANVHIASFTNVSTDLQISTIQDDADIILMPEGDGQVGIGIASPSAKLHVAGDEFITQQLGSPAYISGFTGYGWRFDPSYVAPIGGSDSGSGALLEVDHLSVRGSMNVYELLINQIRATNGNLFVSAVGKVSASVDAGSNMFSMSFDNAEGGGHGFAVGDLIRSQQVDMSSVGGDGPSDGSFVYRSDMIVKEVFNTGLLTAELQNPSDSQSEPSGGYDYVRLGNSGSYPNRQGSLYMTADDLYAPYIDVVDDVDSFAKFNNSGSVKVRLGKLDGISSLAFGNIPTNTYGFWASGSAYLEGGIMATFGQIAGWSIQGNSITSSLGTIVIDATDSGSFHLGSAGSGVTYSSVNTGIYMDGDANFRVGNNSTEAIKFSPDDGLQITSSKVSLTGNAVDINVNNFELDASNIEISSNNASMSLGSTNQINMDADGGTGGAPIIKLAGGEISSSGFFVSTIGEVTASAGKIAGFDINGTRLQQGSNFYIDGGATLGGDGDPYIPFISASKFQVSVEGKVTASAGRIANWEIHDDALKSPHNYIVLDATNQEISIYQQTFGNTGIQLENNSGNPRFHVGDGTSSIKFDSTGGGYLQITSSNVNLSGSDINIVTENLTASGSNVDIQTPKFYLGQGSAQYISGSQGNIEISSSMFHLDPANSKVAISGSVIANDGIIGGWTINQTNLSNIDSNGGISIDAGNKIITARTGSASDTVRVRFGEINSGQFGIQGEDDDGNVIFNLGEQGNSIAGWNITNSTINKTNQIYLDSSTSYGQIWLGSNSYSSAKIGFDGGGAGFVANHSMSWDASGNLQLTSSDLHINTSKFDVTTNDGGRITLGASDEIMLSGSGEGKLASNNISWNTSGDTTIQGNVTMSSDVRIDGGLQIGALPVLPSDDNLVSHWSFNEGAGTTILNHANYSQTGSIMGNAVYTTSSVAGYAVTFDGDGDYVQIPEYYFRCSSSVHGEAQDTAISMWINSEKVGGGANMPGGVGLLQGPNSQSSRDWDSVISIANYTGSSGGTGNASVALQTVSGSSMTIPLNVKFQLNRWHQVGIQYVSSSHLLYAYVDGELASHVNGTGMASAKDVIAIDRIGQGYGGSLVDMSGSIDEVRFYETNLSAGEWRALYVNPAGIGGTRISGDQITTGKIKSNNWTDGGTAGSRINLDDGTFKMGGDTNPNLEFDGTTLSISGSVTAGDGEIGGWTITDTMLSKSNKIYLNSATTHGQIWLGGSGMSTAGIGFVGDGSGFVANNSMSWDSSGNLQLTASRVDISGSDVNITTPKIFLGQGDSNFISASQGNIEISSSKFHLQPGGDTIMQGKITAESGEIAGWTIETERFKKADANGGISIDSNAKRINALTGSNEDTYRVRFGQLDANEYGMQGRDASGNAIFNLGEQGNSIAGWSFDSNAISKNRISLSSYEAALSIVDTNTNEVVLVGDKNMSSITGSDFNYIENPSFETYNSAGWFGWHTSSNNEEAWNDGDGTFVSTTVNPSAGTKHFRISIAAEGAGGGGG